MKRKIMKKMTSLIIAVMMLFIFSADDIKIISDAVNVTADTFGIGIINTVYPASEENTITYQLEFWSEENVSISKPIEFTTTKGKKAVLQTNGKIELESGDSVVFNENEEFNAFVDANAGDWLGVLINPINTVSNGRDTYKFYSDSVLYSYEIDIFGNRMLQMIDLNTYDVKTAKVTEFKSTKYKPLVEVERSWSDRGNSRDDCLYNDFTIMNNSVLVNVAPKYCSIEKSTSNLDIYTYYLPEYDENGNKINYTVNSNLGQFDKDVSHENSPAKPMQLSALEDDPDKPGVKRFSASSKGLTSMKFNIQWLDEAKPCTDSKTEEIIKAYLKAHFTLYNDSGDDQNLANISDNNIIIDTTNWTVEIKGLLDISENNTAITYELRPNATILPLVDNSSQYLKDDDGNDTTEFDLRYDAYELKAVNLGVHSSTTDKIYPEGTLSLLLTGKKDYEGNVSWKDADNSTARTGSSKAAIVTVWRYTDDSNEHQGEADYDPLEKSAQVASQNINGQDDDSSFKVTDVDKYDNKGRLYSYYALEKINVGGNYKIYYVSLTSPQERLPEGDQTIYNKLSAKTVYSIDASWIAAARQGGTASATFVLQRYIPPTSENETGTWVTVSGETEKLDEDGNIVYQDEENKIPVMVPKYVLDIDSFRAEQMEIEKDFPPVEVYDDTGTAYQYRVVQTNIRRIDDNLSTQKSVEYIAENSSVTSKIILGKDTYEVKTSFEISGNKAIFTYTLIGDVNITMKKQWKKWKKDENDNDTNELENDDDITTPAHFVIKKFNVSTKVYDYVDEKNIIGSSQETINVDRYDELGHEIEYIVNETSSFPNYYSTYSFTRDAVTGNYTYVVNNIPSKDPGRHYVSIRKEWADDGEQEFRKPIYIKADGDTTSGDEIIQGVADNEQWVRLAESNAWQERMVIDDAYITKIDDEITGVNIPLNLFSEYFVQNSTEGYWSIDQIQTEANINQEAKWIYGLLSNRCKNLDETYKNSVEAENFIKFGSITNTASNDWQIIGVYRNENHYYAVECKTEAAFMSGTVGGLVFRNTRIGVVNYKIKFNWNIGNQTANIDKVTVKVTPKMQFTDSNGNKVYQYFTIDNHGTISPTNNNDIAYSQSYPISMDAIQTQLADNETGEIIKAVGEYYILNLPKYDTNGVIIKYEIDEVTIIPTSGAPTSITGDTCTFNDNNMEVKIEANNTNFGSTSFPDYNSDDLMNITITNTFVNKTDFLVHKKWYDNTHAYAKRPDLYIRLMRYPEDNPESAEKVPERDKDYNWTKHEGDEENFWHYKFTGLDLYDSRGYRYIYYVEELPMDGYKTAYDNNYDGAVATDFPPAEYLDDPEDTNEEHMPRAQHALNDYGKRDENGQIVYQTAPEIQLNDTTRAYNNGSIVNIISDEVVVDGDKLWQHISSVVDNYKQYFPVAKVYLLRFTTSDGVNYFNAPADNEEIDLSVTPYMENRVASVDIYNGENKFNFQYGNQYTHNELINPDFVMQNADKTIYTKTSPKGSPNNIILPKYDDNGYLIKYRLAEEAINGYAFKISRQTIINDYHGGEPVRFKVEKQWSGPENDEFVQKLKNGTITEDMLPIINVVLHQMIDIPKIDENGEPVLDSNQKQEIETIEYNTIKKQLKLSVNALAEDKTIWTCTFGENNELRTYAPIGNNVKFRYYVTEELSNNDETDPRIITLENNNDKGLGYIFTRYDITKDDNDEIQYSLDEDTNSNVACDTTNATYKLATKEVTGQIQVYGQRITNMYSPQDNNFKGELEITKDWEIKNKDAENILNNEFNNVKAYTFTVSRETKNVGKQTLFTIKTKDDDVNNNPVAPEIKIPEGNSQNSPLYQEDNLNKIFTYADGKYTIELILDKKAVTVTVDPSKKNDVKIQGLAVYARDGVKYTYAVNEGNKLGYIAEVDKPSTIATTSETITEEYTNGQLITRTIETPQPLEFDLKNVLDTFDLRINKCFGAEDEEKNIYEIPSSNFKQYFNAQYVKKIKFELWRGVKTKNPTTNVWEITTPAQLYQKLEDTEPESEDIIFEFDEENNQYYYVFTHLPKYSPEGGMYFYQIVESRNGGEISGQTRNYVKTRYLAENETEFSETPESDELIDYTNTGAPEVNDIYTNFSYSITPAMQSDESEFSFTVQNVFPAELVTIKKIWDDNNNADGLRPTGLWYRVFEKAGTEEIKVDEELENNIIENEAITVAYWKKTIILPKYYYNGGIVADLQFKLDENLPQNSVESELEAEQKKYNVQYKELHDNGYTLDDANSDNEYKAIPVVSGQNELKLTNKKEKRVNGTLSLNKVWNGDDSAWNTRPSAIYFRLYRYKLYPRNSQLYTTTKSVVVESYASDAYDSDATVAINGLVENKDYFKVDAVSDENGNFIYAWTQEHLPIGENNGGTSNYNGNWYEYYYQLVECDANGIEFELDTNNDNFAYSWNYGSGELKTETNAEEEITYYALNKFKFELTEDDVKEKASYTQKIINTFDPISFGFEKTWDDQNNEYNTRAAITVQLQRKLINEADTEWIPIHINLSSKTTKQGIDHWTALEAGEKNEPDDDDSINSDNIANVIIQEKTSANSVAVQSGIVDGLPRCDSNGTPYVYKFVEKKIGSVDVVEGLYHGNAATKTLDYLVEYEADTDNHQTKIENILIKYDPSQDFKAVKTWTDNANQDGQRPAELKVFLLQREWTQSNLDLNTYNLTGITAFQKVMTENHWECEWENYPGFSKDGHLYTYSVVEYYDSTTGGGYTDITENALKQSLSDLGKDVGESITAVSIDSATGAVSVTVQGVSTENETPISYNRIFVDNKNIQINVLDEHNVPIGTPDFIVGDALTDERYGRLTIISDPVRDDDKSTDEKEIKKQDAAITNTQSKLLKSLIVSKEWDEPKDSNGIVLPEYKKLRPANIQFELYCKYTTYKYITDDAEERSTALARIKAGTANDTILFEVDDTYDGPVIGENSLIASYFTTEDSYLKTLQPSDKIDDELWRTGITFTGLPVYINTCGDANWNGKAYAIEYYVKEIDTLNENNPYTFGVGGYKKNSSTKTDLTSDSPSVTATNKLKVRQITVTKNWNDNGYGTSLHYGIDFTLSGSGATDFTYSETKELTTDKSSVIFANVPMYDQNGAVINYSVAEKVHGSTEAIYQSGYYISEITATPNATLTKNDTTYTVTPDSDNEIIITNYTITNTLPVIRFKADKVWNDNSNQDGKRPETLQFTLNATDNTSGNTTGFTVEKSDSSTAHKNNANNWAVDFLVQPEYNPNNVKYTYSASEDVITDYTSEQLVSTTTTENEIKVITFHFKNTYTPIPDSLKIKKQWNDTINETNFSDWTRPAEVEVTLYCSYGADGSATKIPHLVSGDSDVMKLLPQISETVPYQTTRQVKSTENWEKIFENLPLNVNPTGTAVYNGQSYPITYSVVETAINGYTVAYSDSKALTAVEDEIIVTNTLKTKTIKVKKEWIDNYTGNQAQHYDVHLTLTNTNTGVSYTDDKTIAITDATRSVSATKTTSNTIDFIVPQYIANGNAATYNIIENALDQQYGYVTTYSQNPSNNFNASTIENNAVIVITNTLPLTTVSVTKIWDDSNNIYQLRPDNISLQLWRRPVTNNGTAWADENSGWTQCNENYTITKNANHTWTCTFARLPKFDVHNIQYEYKIFEAKVNAYDTYYKNTDNNYVTDYNAVVKQDNETFENNSLSFDVKNTLIKKDVTFVKVWNDNGYTENLHYPVTYRVQKPTDVEMSLDITVTLGENTDSSTIKTTDDMQWSKTMNLPVYDKNGVPIQYTVQEQTQKYGYEASETTCTKNGTAHATGYDTFYDTYQIINELPLTSVEAVKVWDGNLEMYPNASAVVNVKLTRSSNNTADTAFNANNANTKQIVYNNGTNDNVTFEKLLVKDQNNKTYTYTITEQTVQGYSISYTNQTASAVKDIMQIVTITNTPKKATDVQFVKYDVTDLEKHGAENEFSLITLANAKFELYRVREDLQDGDSNKVKQVYIVQDKDSSNHLIAGSYSMKGLVENTAPALIISNENGVINLNNLEPNKYYLIEKEAPDGYQLNEETENNPRKFEFEVKINNSNNIEIDYTDKKVTKENGILKLDANDFTVANAKIALTDLSGVNSVYTMAGIPNEENESYLKLTKKDEKEEIPLSNAYYYLLRLYDFKYRKSGTEGDTEAVYLEKAIEALKTNYHNAVGLYWEKVGNEYYQTNDNGTLQASGNGYGIYVFYEVKAPDGYDINNVYSNTVNDSANVLGPVEFHSNYTASEHNLIHYEPRKNAQIKILKTDDFGNPLKDAAFDLYQVVENGDDVKLATITTGYDGMNDEVILSEAVTDITVKNKAIEFDTSKYDWNTEFYFLETTAPNGYSAFEDDNIPKKVTFKLTPAIAEELLHIVRANDTRLKGKVTLTKIASEATSTHNAGDPLQGAIFNLYRAGSSTPLNDTELITDVNGKISVENLEWGDYYFEETTAPDGFELPDTTEEKRVYFTVGRGNCGEIAQELIMENQPKKASLNIIKHIDTYDETAWGKPSFIFKITQTKLSDGSIQENPVTLTKIITPITSVTDGFEGQTNAFDIEPGTYTITEMQTARYTAEKNSVFIKSDSVSEMTNEEYTATFTISDGGKAEIKFFNKLTYYDKFSHANSVTNTFNGYKAIRLNDKSNLELTNSTPTTDTDQKYTITIPKSEFSPLLVKSDGTISEITDYENLTITTEANDISIFEEKITNEKDSIKITGRKEDVSGSVYKLKAVYKGVTPNLTTYFELRFKDTLQFSKTEKIVIFRSDENNKIYYLDGNAHTLVYTLDFIMETISDENGERHSIKSILHDGVSLETTNENAFPQAQIDPAFSAEAEFEQWEYSYETTVAHTGKVSTEELLTVIQNAPDNVEITVRAVLK